MRSPISWWTGFFLVAAWPVLAMCQSATGGEAGTLSLDEAITLALRENRDVKTAVLEIGKAGDRLSAARTRRLPEFKFYGLGSELLSSIDFRFDQGVFGSYPGIGPIPAQNTVISTPRKPNYYFIGQINQPISQLYRTNLNLKQLALGREIAEQQARAQRQAVINNVKQAYYAILQSQTALRSTVETLKLYRELDRLTGEYVVQQVALKSESLEVKTRLAKSELDEITMRDQLASQKEQLNRLLGRDLQTEFDVTAAPAVSFYEVDLPAAREQAMRRRPEIEQARLKFKQAEMDRRIKKSEYIPDLSLSFSYISQQNINFAPRQVASLGALLTWEPFDWGRKKREIAEKTKSIEQAEQSMRETESSVLTEVNAKFRKLQQTRQMLVIGRLTEETAIEQVRVASNRYAAQSALMKEVLQAQASLADANHQHQQAVLAFWTARADFEKAIGGDQ